MNGRQTVAVSVLVTVALVVALGITIRVYERGQWWARLRDAQVSITANQTALVSAGATGQPVQRLLGQCADSVDAYNTAAQHLGLPHLATAMECQP